MRNKYSAGGLFVLLFILCSAALYGQKERPVQFNTSFGAGLGYFLEISHRADVHSLDTIVENKTAAIFLGTGPFHFGLFIQSALLFPNFLFPETSHFVIYDSVLRLTVLGGPYVNFFWKRLDIYAGAGMHFLVTMVRHDEQSEGLGNIYYERFEADTGIGIDLGIKINFGIFFLKIGGISVYDFRRWTSYTSKFADYAGWEGPLFEIRPFLIAGFSPKKGNGKKPGL
jgi:hypothetical protein